MRKEKKKCPSKLVEMSSIEKDQCIKKHGNQVFLVSLENVTVLHAALTVSHKDYK